VLAIFLLQPYFWALATLCSQLTSWKLEEAIKLALIVAQFIVEVPEELFEIVVHQVLELRLLYEQL